jgi:hypothetical protein
MFLAPVGFHASLSSPIGTALARNDSSECPNVGGPDPEQVPGEWTSTMKQLLRSAARWLQGSVKGTTARPACRGTRGQRTFLLEQLEDRLVPSASMSGTTLLIQATQPGESIKLDVDFWTLEEWDSYPALSKKSDGRCFVWPTVADSSLGGRACPSLPRLGRPMHLCRARLPACAGSPMGIPARTRCRIRSRRQCGFPGFHVASVAAPVNLSSGHFRDSHNAH